MGRRKRLPTSMADDLVRVHVSGTREAMSPIRNTGDASTPLPADGHSPYAPTATEHGDRGSP